MKNLNNWLKILLIVLLSVLLVVFGALGVPRISKTIATWGNAEIVAAITLAGVIVALSVPFVERFIKIMDEVSVYQIEINVDTSLDDNVVLFSASIKNTGDKTINLNIANLYFDEGIEERLPDDLYQSKEGTVASYFDFPFILEHKKKGPKGRPDCVICQECFREKKENYPKEVLSGKHGSGELLHTHKTLDHLSRKSIEYICPKESFTEDILVRFPKKGAYRVTLFVGMEGDADCMCATKQFYIAHDYVPADNKATQQGG